MRVGNFSQYEKLIITTLASTISRGPYAKVIIHIVPGRFFAHFSYILNPDSPRRMEMALGVLGHYHPI